jgi:hypothetical protein
MLAWTPEIAKGGIGGGIAAGMGAISSLIAEIVVYYLTEGEPKDQRVSVSL